MTTYFNVPLPGVASSPFSGNTVGVTGATFIPGTGQGSRLSLGSAVNSNVPAPSFSPTLDGNAYKVQVVWNLFARRYYLNCYDGSDAIVFSVALVSSPASMVIQTLSWNPASLLVTATTTLPHGLPIAATVDLTIAGANPDAYNGAYGCFVTGTNAFQYSIPSEPGPVVSPGAASYLISMCAGYFSSTLIYRGGQFEVSP